MPAYARDGALGPLKQVTCGLDMNREAPDSGALSMIELCPRGDLNQLTAGYSIVHDSGGLTRFTLFHKGIRATCSERLSRLVRPRAPAWGTDDLVSQPDDGGLTTRVAPALVRCRA